VTAVREYRIEQARGRHAGLRVRKVDSPFAPVDAQHPLFD